METMISLSDDTNIKKVYSVLFEPEVPLDLALVVAWSLACIAGIYIPILNATPIRYVLSIPFVLFIPGYCLIAALFPREKDFSILERIALSIGFSMVIVSLIGLGLTFTPDGIWLNPIIFSLILFTFVSVIIAYIRRAFVKYEDRFRIPFSKFQGTIRKGIFPIGGGRMDHILGVLLLFVIIIAIITTFYVIVFPQEGRPFSEFYILGENQTATNYPNLTIAGQNYPIYIGVGNKENRDVVYTIEIWEVQTEFDNMTNMSRIIAVEPDNSLSFTLPNNETIIVPYNLSIKNTGYNRVDFLLFNETIPNYEVIGRDRVNASYRSLNLWGTVR
jgi:uncharacterized membrane protein